MNAYREPGREPDPEPIQPARKEVGSGYLLTSGEHCACAVPGFLSRWWHGIKEDAVWQCGNCGQRWKWDGVYFWTNLITRKHKTP